MYVVLLCSLGLGLLRLILLETAESSDRANGHGSIRQKLLRDAAHLCTLELREPGSKALNAKNSHGASLKQQRNVHSGHVRWKFSGDRQACGRHQYRSRSRPKGGFDVEAARAKAEAVNCHYASHWRRISELWCRCATSQPKNFTVGKTTTSSRSERRWRESRRRRKERSEVDEQQHVGLLTGRYVFYGRIGNQPTCRVCAAIDRREQNLARWM